MNRLPSPRELAELCRGVGTHGRRIIITALKRGITVQRLPGAWHFRSAQVDILTVDPKFLNLRELDPP